MKANLQGFGTRWNLVTAAAPDQVPDNDLAWEVMFVYGDSHPALRDINFAGMPSFDPRLVRRVLTDKHAYADAARTVEPPHADAPGGDRCVLCRLQFGSWYDDPTFGSIKISRNRRNRFYCNVCDAFIRICPGQATLTLPVLVVDVKGSRAIRRQIGDLRRYSQMVAAFQRQVSAVIQDHLGFVLNTMGDAVVGVWPSGFVPDEARRSLGWDPRHPARIPAVQAIRAAERIAAVAPVEFDGHRLPFRGALDTSDMIVFAVTSRDAAPHGLGARPEDAEVGDPVLSADPSDFGVGPAATDIAGQAVETAAELASDDDLPGGVVCVTRSTDVVAGHDPAGFQYREIGPGRIAARLVLPASAAQAAELAPVPAM